MKRDYCYQSFKIFILCFILIITFLSFSVQLYKYSNTLVYLYYAITGFITGYIVAKTIKLKEYISIYISLVTVFSLLILYVIIIFIITDFSLALRYFYEKLLIIISCFSGMMLGIKPINRAYKINVSNKMIIIITFSSCSLLSSIFINYRLLTPIFKSTRAIGIEGIPYKQMNIAKGCYQLKYLTDELNKKKYYKNISEINDIFVVDLYEYNCDSNNIYLIIECDKAKNCVYASDFIVNAIKNDTEIKDKYNIKIENKADLPKEPVLPKRRENILFTTVIVTIMGIIVSLKIRNINAISLLLIAAIISFVIGHLVLLK